MPPHDVGVQNACATVLIVCMVMDMLHALLPISVVVVLDVLVSRRCESGIKTRAHHSLSRAVVGFAPVSNGFAPVSNAGIRLLCNG